MLRHETAASGGEPFELGSILIADVRQPSESRMMKRLIAVLSLAVFGCSAPPEAPGGGSPGGGDAGSDTGEPVRSSGSLSGGGAAGGGSGAGGAGSGGQQPCFGPGCDCSTPEPSCPEIEGCLTALICNANNKWDCVHECSGCFTVEPECELDTASVCEEPMWTCQSTSTACAVAPAPDCGPVSTPECPYYPVCHSDGQWACQQSCKYSCNGPAPDCPPDEGGCTQTVVCTQIGWACAESCL